MHHPLVGSLPRPAPDGAKTRHRGSVKQAVACRPDELTLAGAAHDIPHSATVDFGVQLRYGCRPMAKKNPRRLDPELLANPGRIVVPKLVRMPTVRLPPRPNCARVLHVAGNRPSQITAAFDRSAVGTRGVSFSALPLRIALGAVPLARLHLALAVPTRCHDPFRNRIGWRKQGGMEVRFKERSDHLLCSWAKFDRSRMSVMLGLMG
jgi:hypothetical protein